MMRAFVGRAFQIMRNTLTRTATGANFANESNMACTRAANKLGNISSRHRTPTARSLHAAFSHALRNMGAWPVLTN